MGSELPNWEGAHVIGASRCSAEETRAESIPGSMEWGDSGDDRRSSVPKCDARTVGKDTDSDSMDSRVNWIEGCSELAVAVGHRQELNGGSHEPIPDQSQEVGIGTRVSRLCGEYVQGNGAVFEGHSSDA